MKRVDCISGCEFEPIPGLVDRVLDGRWLIDIDRLAGSLFDADIKAGVFGVKEGDHLFYLGRADCDDQEAYFYVLIRNVAPVPKHIFFKKLKSDGNTVLRYSYMGEVEGRLGGMYVMLKDEEYQKIL